MTLYHHSLLLRNQSDINSRSQIEDALKGFEYSYFYTGKRVGDGRNIELEVCTLVIDAAEHMYLRSCEYTGLKEDWKEAIKAQLVKHLHNIGVEQGFVKSETRYFEVSPDNHFPREKYENKLLEVIAKIRGNENNSL